MKNTIINYTLVLLLASSAFVSCKKDEVDNTKPTIKLVAPANDDTLSVGHSVHFDCEFADNVELKSYKVDIHSNFDGHTHEKSLSAMHHEGHPFSYTNSWNFEAGKKNSDIHHHEIAIPDSVMGEENVLEPIAQGKYHFAVYCTDANGNESKTFIDVVIAEGSEHDHDDDHDDDHHND